MCRVVYFWLIEEIACCKHPSLEQFHNRRWKLFLMVPFWILVGGSTVALISTISYLIGLFSCLTILECKNNGLVTFAYGLLVSVVVVPTIAILVYVMYAAIIPYCQASCQIAQRKAETYEAVAGTATL